MFLLVRHFYRFGPFDLDAEQRVVRRDGTKIALPPKAFEVLLYLVKNPLRLITKEELLREVWPDSFVEEGNLTQNIFLLRKALATGKNDFRYIVTIPGRGYQFASAVEFVDPSPENDTALSNDRPLAASTIPEATISDATIPEAISELDGRGAAASANLATPTDTIPPTPHRHLEWWVGGAVLLLLGLAASFYWWKHHRQPLGSQTLVLADFINRTGDGSFDVVLKKALEIDLTQSPYLDMMSDQEAIEMLRLMGRDPEATVTPDVAKEICLRDNRQVMVSGSIANLGHQYLLALEAIDCVSGKKLIEAKAEAASKEKVLAALDSIADRLRAGLGESTKSVQQFEIPIAQATTSSLEALKAYSIGEDMLGRTNKDETETLPLFQRAIELDPDFAMAYAAVATDYYNLKEPKLAAPYYQKAFDLSGRASEKERVYIRAHYYADSRNDLQQGIKEYRLWAETYPHDWGSWLNIARLYTLTGQYSAAIIAGEQALRLDGSRGINHSVLARAYLRANRYADAKSTVQRAVKMGKDSYELHSLLYQLAFLENDQAAMGAELAWSRGKPAEWRLLDLQASAAATEGRCRQAEQLFRRAYGIVQHENLVETADDVLLDQASAEIACGMPNAGRTTLSQVRKEDADNPDFAFLKAKLGDTSFAERLLGQYSGEEHARHAGDVCLCSSAACAGCSAAKQTSGRDCCAGACRSV